MTIRNNILNSFINIKKSIKFEDGMVRHWKSGTYKRKSPGVWEKMKLTKEDKQLPKNLIPDKIPTQFKKLLPLSFFQSLGLKPDVRTYKNDQKCSPYYSSVSNRVYIFEGTSDWDKMVYIHELGHYYHTNKNIVTDHRVDREFFEEVWTPLKDSFFKIPIEIRNHLKDINKKGLAGISYKNINKYKELINKYYGLNEENVEMYDDKLTVLSDIIESITRGEYGYGHGKKYQKDTKYNAAEQEIFAHTMQNYFMKNELVEKIFQTGMKSVNNYFEKQFN